MADKLMYIPNGDTHNYPYCRLQLLVERFVHSLNKPNNENSMKIPKLVKLTNM